MYHFQQALRLRAHSAVRGLATSSKGDFTKVLSSGPTLDDFIRGDVEDTVVLGNTSQ